MLVTVNCPESCVANVGVNVTGNMQLAPAASVVTQALPSEKSIAPLVIDIADIASCAVPVLVMVTLFDALILPTSCGAKNK